MSVSSVIIFKKTLHVHTYTHTHTISSCAHIHTQSSCMHTHTHTHKHTHMLDRKTKPRVLTSWLGIWTLCRISWRTRPQFLDLVHQSKPSMPHPVGRKTESVQKVITALQQPVTILSKWGAVFTFFFSLTRSSSDIIWSLFLSYSTPPPPPKPLILKHKQENDL